MIKRYFFTLLAFTGMEVFATADGVSYSKDEHGVIHQLNPQPFNYDNAYISTYHTQAYKEKSLALSAARLAFVCASYGTTPDSILDFGYGDGSFLNLAGNLIPQRYGYDISQCHPPEGVRAAFIDQQTNVYTFWDSLEHCPDISFIENVPCEMIAISLPFCHTSNPEWFNDWKHRKPDEHLHHFDSEALVNFFAAHGWYPVSISNMEDMIRRPVDNKQNILTAAFKRI